MRLLENNNVISIGIFIGVVCLIAGCQTHTANSDGTFDSSIRTGEEMTGLFELVDPEYSNIDFFNNIYENFEQNFTEYDYMYNGAGVAVGDLNNDGLPDLYFAGNMVDDRLYINKGDLVFEDKTAWSNIALNKGWSTGVNGYNIIVFKQTHDYQSLC